MLSASLHEQAARIADTYQPPDTGRPSVIGNRDTLTELLEQIAQGASREAACQVAGLSMRTLQRMIERAEAGEDPERAFVALLKRAEGLVEARVTKNVLKASELPQFWAAGMTYLERKHPERWGKRSEEGNSPRVVVQIGVKDSDVQVQVSTISDQPTHLSPPLSADIHSLTPCSTELSCLRSEVMLTEEKATAGHPLADPGARSAEGSHPVPARHQRGRRAAPKSASGAGQEKKAGA